MTYSELSRELKKGGCRLLREGSNHEVWLNREGRQFIVARHKTREVPAGTCHAILRQAGLKK